MNNDQDRLVPMTPHQPISPVVEEILLEKMRNWTFISVEGVRSVAVSPMPDRVLRIARSQAEYKRCYHNAARIAASLSEFDCRYVTGYARIGPDPVPFEHAWIKIGDRHYDPTWEIFTKLGLEYIPIYELTLAELAEVKRLRRRATPPTPLDLQELGFRRGLRIS